MFYVTLKDYFTHTATVRDYMQEEIQHHTEICLVYDEGKPAQHGWYPW